MNQRIRELIEQATEPPEFPANIGYFNQEKFAELIVNECLEQIYSVTVDNSTDDWDQGYNSGLYQAAETIKEHFRTEE